MAATVFFYALFRKKFIGERRIKFLALIPTLAILAAVYKISAFWAGQQGSFLFWLLIHAPAGFALALKKSPLGALGVYFFLQILICAIVAFNPPFAENPIAVSDGIGLNPMLQDPWMAIHPPLIFAGYALLAVPFSLGLGNLIEAAPNKNWLKPARSWTLAAWAFLGAGIFIGGYWAYKVLGWGGYWAWDPVENSSLVPYLVSAVLLHLIILSEKKSAVLPMAHVAAVFAYALVIYGTFLTRSGILSEFSVHSFAGSGISLVIAVINAVILIGGLFIILIRAKNFAQGKMYENFKDPAYATLLGMLIIVFMAVIIWLGMSAPLLSRFLERAAAVDAAFYEKTTKPLALIMAALMIYIFARNWRLISFGGKLAHFGVIFGVAAILISSSGETDTRILENGVETELFGHKIIYCGQIFEGDSRRKFYVYNVDGQEIRALTKLRVNGDDAAREPAILKTFGGDIYIAPNPQSNFAQELILEQGKFQMDGEIGYTFEGAEYSRNEQDFLISVAANIEVTDGITSEIARPMIFVSRDGGVSDSIEILNRRRRIRLTGVSKDNSTIRLEILPTLEEISDAPILTTISTKPFIWVLWLSAAAIKK